MIEVKNLWFKYEEDFILKNIGLEIKENSFTAVIGSNGSGKTTLAKHFNALLMPTKGHVFVDAIDTKKDEFSARKKVGFVFQNFEDQLIYSIVEEDIAFGLENLGFKNGEIDDIVEKILDELKIKHLAKNNVNMLSAGQKQLVALAGILLHPIRELLRRLIEAEERLPLAAGGSRPAAVGEALRRTLHLVDRLAEHLAGAVGQTA